MKTLSPRIEALLISAILVSAGAMRAGVALRNPIPAGDGIATELEMARNLADGDGFSTMRKWTLYDPSTADIRPEGNRQPAMSSILALFFMLAGPSFRTAQAVSLAVGLGALLAAWWWARRAFGQVAALAGLAWLSLDPVMVWFSTQPDSLMLFTALFFLAMAAGGGGAPTVRVSALAGMIAGAAFLARTQGLVFAASIGLWILVSGGRRRLVKALVFTLVFLALALPWLLRNQEAFGSPLYSQNSQFLLNENHWAAWEVRGTAPSPADMLRNQGAPVVAVAVVAGVLRIIEPLTIGTLHRGEVFAWPPLILFTICAIYALGERRNRRMMILPAFASIPMMATLVLHEHSGRYLTFMTTAVIFLGTAGALDIMDRLKLPPLLRLLMASAAVLPLARPLTLLARSDSRERAIESETVSSWISSHSEPDDWVVTFPNVELLIWEYRRPTLTMPNDYEMLLWPCLEEHSTRYVVVDPDLPRLRPWLSSRWRMSPDGSGWEVVDPPPFLSEVFRSESGRTIVYEWTGPVPEGFMAVDDLPRDNCRALPPQS